VDAAGDGKRGSLGAPVALISGCTGQDGSYLARLLLEKGYTVHGIVRRSSSFNTGRIDDIRERLTLHYGDMNDGSSLYRILNTVCPNEVYNLAAQSHVGVSYEVPEYTAESDALGPLRFLEAIKGLGMQCRFYQASTSELFGDSPPPQSEETPFRPRSPYAAAKLYAYWIVRQYRDAYGIHASNGILHNHESPIRGENFVTRKVCKAAARGETVRLGNLNAIRDWGHARDYVDGMWRIVQHHKPDDYVLATGVGHSVMELCIEAYGYMGMMPKVEVDQSYKRPLDVDVLIGDASKARKVLGWKPRTTFKELIAEMMEAEIDSARKAGLYGQRTEVPDGVHRDRVSDARREIRGSV
jgi:GDPmannose 4,6-dehydratase